MGTNSRTSKFSTQWNESILILFGQSYEYQAACCLIWISLGVTKHETLAIHKFSVPPNKLSDAHKCRESMNHSSFVVETANEFLLLFCSSNTSRYNTIHQKRSKIGALAHRSCYQISETFLKGCQSNGCLLFVSCLCLLFGTLGS